MKGNSIYSKKCYVSYTAVSGIIVVTNTKIVLSGDIKYYSEAFVNNHKPLDATIGTKVCDPNYVAFFGLKSVFTNDHAVQVCLLPPLLNTN